MILTTAAQREIEKSSPQICGYDDEIRKKFFDRDAPGWEQKPLIDDLWYQTYQEAVAQNKAEIANDERNLKATLDEYKKHRLEHTSKQVDAKTVPRLPKMGGMQYVKSQKPRYVGLVPEPKSTIIFGAGSRTRTLTGRGVMEKARKEAQEQSLLKNRLAIPTHKLQQRASRVKHVPYSLAADHSRPSVVQPIDPTIKPAEVFIPKRKRVALEESVESEPSSANDQERPIKKFKTATTGAVSSDTAEKASPPPQALAKKAPRPGKLVRPPMKAKRPVDIFLPSKRR